MMEEKLCEIIAESRYLGISVEELKEMIDLFYKEGEI